MIPKLGFLPEEEKFEVSAFTRVRAVKMVVFPTVGRPTIPQLRGMDGLAVYRVAREDTLTATPDMVNESRDARTRRLSDLG
jgi:hypothetical protein